MAGVEGIVLAWLSVLCIISAPLPGGWAEEADVPHID